MSCFNLLVGITLFAFWPLTYSRGSEGWTDLEFKAELEKSLTAHSREVIDAIIPKTHYYFVVSAKLEPLPAAPQEQSKGLLPVTNEDEIKELQGKMDKVFLDKIGGYWSNSVNDKPTSSRDVQRVVQKIDATLVYDETIDAERLKLAKKSLETYYKSYTSKVTFALQKQKIYMEPKKQETPVPPMQMKDWIEMLKDPVALLIVGLIAAIGYIAANSKRVAVERMKVDAMNAATAAATAANAPGSNEQVAQETHGKPSESQTEVAIPKIDTSQAELVNKEAATLVARLDSIFETRPSDIKLLLKSWIAEESEAAQCGLTLLTRYLSLAKIDQMVSFLSGPDKEIWKKKIIADFDATKAYLGIQFILASISRHYLTEDKLNDAELKEMFSTISPRNAAEVIRSAPHLAGPLFSNLSNLQIARVFAILNMDELSSSLRQSVVGTGETNASTIADLKLKISTVQARENQAVNPFVDRIFELIKDVQVSREHLLFESMAATGQEELVAKLSVSNFPAALIPELPGPFLVSVFNKFSVQRKAEILLAQDEATRAKLMNCFGESGKLRDMIDLEMQAVSSNQLKLKSIEKSKDTLWGDFVRVTREIYRSQPDEPVEIEELRKKWIKELVQKNFKGEASVDKNAA